VLKQGSKTNSSLRQRNLQPQNEAALASCRMRAVEHKKSAVGLSGAHPGLPDWLLYAKFHKFGFFQRHLASNICLAFSFEYLACFGFSNILLKSVFGVFRRWLVYFLKNYLETHKRIKL